MKLAMLLVLFSFSMTTVGYAAGQEYPEYEEIAKYVATRISYKMDEQIQTVIYIGEAIQFDCLANPFGLGEYIVFPANDGRLWICYLDTDGNVIDKRNTNFHKVNGSLQQVADVSCLAILKWEVEDEKITLSFCLSTNKGKNQQERDNVTSGIIRMAQGYKNSKSYPPRSLSETDRIAGFVQLWSEVKFNFAFFDQVPDLDWDQTLVDYLPKIQKAGTIEDYYLTLRQCIALLQDGHTSVSGPGLHPAQYRLPIEVQPIAKGKSIIVGIIDPENIRGIKRRSELENAKLELFEEVTHINARPVNEVLVQDIYPHICASTPQGRNFIAYDRLLKGEYNSKVTLRIRNHVGDVRDVTLTRGSYPSKTDSHPFALRELENGIVYVNLPGFGTDQVVHDFEEVFPRIQKAEALILDVRYNVGGSGENGYAIIGMLTDRTIKSSRWKTRKYLPAFRAWGEEEQWYEGEQDSINPTVDHPYVGPIVVLTGPRTFSAAEDFVVALHASKRATIVGQRTGGSTGQPLFIMLPGGGMARICTKRDTYPDGRDFVGIGVIPDLEISPTKESYISGEDVVLNKGIEVVQKMMLKE